MTHELPPWREIMTDDYAPCLFTDLGASEAWIASSETLRVLLVRKHEGEFRLRLVLREGVDLRWGQPQTRAGGGITPMRQSSPSTLLRFGSSGPMADASV
ncbi:hypothetical protein ASF32_12965 [Methylobacterium sp. Leaf91]|mgnify:CR=1 FL=1|nr:hypothetical protein ASF32_12965 [Methylobacterium sp. Leaf91]